MALRTYVGIVFCIILLCLSAFMLLNLGKVILESKQKIEQKPKRFEEAFSAIFYGLLMTLYLPHTVIQLQFCLLSIVLLIVLTSIGEVSAKKVAASIAIGVIISFVLIYYAIQYLPKTF